MRYTQSLSMLLLLLLMSASVQAQSVDYAQMGEKGIQAFSQGNLIQAMDLLNQSAQNGYAPAQSTLAYILDQGEENERAFELFKQAAEQNDAAGQYGLAGMYAKGEGTPQNPQLAGEWMKKSAMQRYILAMRAYANALERGELGLDRDTSQAVHWYNQCNEAGDAVCKRRLAEAYARGELGLALDETKARQLLRELNVKQEVEK